MDVALVSCRELPEPDLDAAPLARALEAAGISADVLAWDDPRADWSRARLTVLRSTWNYPQRHEAFREWLTATARVTELWNPPSVVLWNLHKRYLLDLQRRGVAVTPTEVVDRGDSASLEALLARRGWDEVVIKPAISATSYRTLRVGRERIDHGQNHLGALAERGDVLVQPYLRSVEGHGERALVWIDGVLTHAVRKTPRFAGQDESVSERAVEILPAEERLARRAIAAVGRPLFYARIDVAPGPDGGEPVVMELELIEPSLFFGQGPEALRRFVQGIGRRLGRGRGTGR